MTAFHQLRSPDVEALIRKLDFLTTFLEHIPYEVSSLSLSFCFHFNFLWPTFQSNL